MSNCSCSGHHSWLDLDIELSFASLAYNLVHSGVKTFATPKVIYPIREKSRVDTLYVINHLPTDTRASSRLEISTA